MTFDKLRAKWERERLERHSQAQQRRRAVEEQAPPVLKRFGVQEAILFGSALKGVSRPGSDVDLLVRPLEQSKYWDLRRELEHAIGFPLDLYTQYDDPVLVNKIIERGEVVYRG